MIHHIGVVAFPQQAQALLALMRSLVEVHTVGSRKIEVWSCCCYMYSINDGNTLFEIVVPYGGKLADWAVERPGASLHHYAVQVKDLRKTCRRLREENIMLVSEEPVEGVGGILVNFIHPKHVGVMIELVEVPHGGRKQVPSAVQCR